MKKHKPKPVYLRYRDLQLLGACDQKKKFKELFGSKVLATVTTAVAHAKEFDWLWIGEAALTHEAYVQMRARLRMEHGTRDCYCGLCDPGQSASRFVAQCFAEAFLAQGGMIKVRKRERSDEWAFN